MVLVQPMNMSDADQQVPKGSLQPSGEGVRRTLGLPRVRDTDQPSATDWGSDWDLDQKVAALWRAARLGPTVERLRRHVLQGGSQSIEPGQFRALDAVAGHGPATIRALSDIMDVEPSTVTRAITRLEADGLVFKRRAERDHREVFVALTELGAARHQYFVDRAYRIYEEIFTVFDTAERAVLADLLERMLVSTDAALARLDARAL
ncbi:MarR family winged helix-turn-helix transcriptional regulator [Candidatus Poriferisodalis sp.]|uniref:MarR family winged helix-turn-helix transcriptional regulator n=1 Tax=Candidatus Poriferisodalis sp. TaxID=3101277 RepID=UPI003B021C8A